jgi:hypothetical protein
MAELNLARGTFQLEHTDKAAQTAGTNDYILGDYATGVCVKTEFVGAATSVTVHVRWLMASGETMVEEQTSVASGSTGSVIDDNLTDDASNDQHGGALFFLKPGEIQSLRVDIDAYAGAGSADVWVAGI